MTDTTPTQEAIYGFEIFRHETRIRIVEELSSDDVPVDCATLADELPEEPSISTQSASSQEQALHHLHLPVLDKTDVITYDADALQITMFDPDRLATLIEVTQNLLQSLETGSRSDSPHNSR
ncbi:DUF7344 domain-containing protein [Haloarcula marismortui]|uniref:DUF7344 domain-containing protein n=1 Tax=Haloarcula marismortui ATCC 33800 TaxID=662476 RepID=M0JQT5_9EURY|nr:hypothetical protein [Haloarcula sinaiiensis]EMA09990.1 hypothetical protein C436_18266 [Haloarcula sinaiiensis ATCC 33800]QUJ74982.1 hypothetical protein KDQ40_22300 [Haloarcula sinaiiensis ATCC 33800]